MEQREKLNYDTTPAKGLVDPMEISGAELALQRCLKLRQGYFTPRSTSHWVRLWEEPSAYVKHFRWPGQHPERHSAVNSPSGRGNELAGWA